MFLGAAKHLGDDDRNQLTVEANSTEGSPRRRSREKYLSGQAFNSPFSASWGLRQISEGSVQRSRGYRR